jgi:hypothetical protein
VLAFEGSQDLQRPVVLTGLEYSPGIFGRAGRQFIPRLLAASLDLPHRLLTDAPRTLMVGCLLQGFLRRGDRVFVVAGGQVVLRPGGRRPCKFDSLPLAITLQAKTLERVAQLYRGGRPGRDRQCLLAESQRVGQGSGVNQLGSALDQVLHRELIQHCAGAIDDLGGGGVIRTQKEGVLCRRNRTGVVAAIERALSGLEVDGQLGRAQPRQCFPGRPPPSRMARFLFRSLHEDRLAARIGVDGNRLAEGVHFQPDALHVAPHGRQILIPGLGVLLERTPNDFDDLLVESWTEGLQRRRRLVQDSVDDAVLKPARERLPLGQKLVHHRANREDIAAIVHNLPGHLLRGHVVERPDQHPRHRHPGLGDARDAEVEDLHAALVLHHHVRRLDVPVDDGHLVREAEAVAQLVDDGQLARDTRLRVGPDDLGERLAVDVLHGDERLTIVLTDVEDGDDVRVPEAGNGAGFPVEALPQLLHILAQQLDCDLALEDRVPGEVQRAHPAASDAVHDLKAPDGGRRGAHGF